LSRLDAGVPVGAGVPLAYCASNCNRQKVFLLKNIEKELNSALILITVCFNYHKKNLYHGIHLSRF